MHTFQETGSPPGSLMGIILLKEEFLPFLLYKLYFIKDIALVYCAKNKPTVFMNQEQYSLLKLNISNPLMLAMKSIQPQPFFRSLKLLTIELKSQVEILSKL